jgi:hypothetical protein
MHNLCTCARENTCQHVPSFAFFNQPATQTWSFTAKPKHGLLQPNPNMVFYSQTQTWSFTAKPLVAYLHPMFFHVQKCTCIYIHTFIQIILRILIHHVQQKQAACVLHAHLHTIMHTYVKRRYAMSLQQWRQIWAPSHRSLRRA